MVAKTSLLALLLALAFAPLASADEARGVVVQVDTGKKQLVLEGRGLRLRGNVLTITWGNDIQVLFGQKPAAPADLAPGTRVRVVYEQKNGVMVGVSVHAMGAPAPPPAQPGAVVPPPPPAAENPPAPGAISGVLRRVAWTEREIIVAKPTGQQGAETYSTLAVAPDAMITRDGKAVKFEDLKEGDAVVIKAEERAGKQTAVSIQVGQAPVMAAEQPNRLDRVRKLLKIAEKVLDIIDEQQRNKP